MLIIAGHVRVPETAKAALQAPLEVFVAATRSERGCRDFSFAWDTLDSEIMRVFEIFDDEAAFEAHRQSAHMAVWRAVREKLGVIRTELSSYTISEHRTI
jgi:quinol monooxygenase YgiN